MLNAHSKETAYKYEILARCFYFLDDKEHAPFLSNDYDDISDCYFIANRYIAENKADDFLKALIATNNNAYFKALEDYKNG